MAKRKPDYSNIFMQDVLRNYDTASSRAARERAFMEDILPGLEQDGALNTAQVAALMDQYVRTGNIDDTAIPGFREMAEQPEPAAAPVLPQAASQEEPSFFERTLNNLLPGQFARDSASATVDAIQAGAERTAASAIGRASLSKNPYIAALGQLPGQMVDVVTSDVAGFLRAAEDPQAAAMEDVERLQTMADENQMSVDAFKKSLAGRSWLTRQLGEGVLDAASSPSGAASIVGGPFGAVSVLDAYNQAYMDAWKAQKAGEKLSDEDLEIWAISQAAPELISLIPAEKVLERLPGINKLVTRPAKKAVESLATKLTNPAIRAAVRTAKTAGGEAAEEGLTNVTQGLVAAVIAGSNESEGLGRFAEERDIDTVQEGLESFGQGARAGLVFGGLSAPSNVVGARREYAEGRRAQAEETINQSLQGQLAARQTPAQAAQQSQEGQTVAGAQADFLAAPAPEGAGTGQEGRAVEPYADWATREAGRMPVRQEDLPADAEDFNRLPTRQPRVPARATRAGAATAAEESSRRTKIADVHRENERLAGEVAREQLAQDQFEQQKADESNELRSLTSEVEQERAKQQAAAEKKAKDEAAKAAKKEAADRAKLRAQLVAENPDASNTEIAIKLREALRNMREGTTTPAEQPAAAKPAATVPVSAAQETPAKPDAETTEDDVRQLAAKLGIAAPESETGARPEDTAAGKDTDAAFIPRFREFVHGLANRQDQKSVDVQNLLRQGKLIVGTTPQSVGLKSDTAGAMYRDSEGKMYVFLDRMDAEQRKNPLATVAATIHEATHAGQFNGREGRPSIYRQMMGNDGFEKANGLIRTAASKGNKLAQKAVAAAERANKTAAGRMGEQAGKAVGELELVPYFVEQAVKSRATTYGQLAGVVKDLRAGAKKLLNKAGLNRDLSLNDMDAAAQQLTGEIVRTDIQAKESAAPDVEMEIGPSGKKFAEARERGDVYESDIEPGKYAFEVSDKYRGTAPEDLQRLKLGGHDVALNDVFYHPEVAENYPDLWARTIVRLNNDPSYKGSAHYDKTGEEHMITLSAQEVQRAKEGNQQALHNVRSTMLHEIQHLIQGEEGWAGGANPEDFMPRSVAARIAQSARRIEDKVKKFELGTALNNMPEASRKRWEDEKAFIISPEGMTERDAEAWAFLDGGWYKDSKSPTVKRFGESYATEQQEHMRALDAKYDAEKKAFRTYMRDKGEVESRTTQARADMTQAELKALPRSQQIITWRTTDGENITRQDAVDTEDLRRVRKPLDTLESAVENGATESTVPEERLSDKEHLARILNKGRNNETADIKLAEAYDTRYRRAMKKDVGVRYDRPETHKEIMAALQEIEDADRLNRGPKWEAFATKYPNLAPVIADMRAEIDKGTDEIVQKILYSGRPLSKEDIKNVETLLANRGKYLRRAYSAFQGRGLGRKWAQNRWADYKKRLDTWLQSPERLSPHVRANVEAVHEALERIEKEITIPDDEALLGLRTEKLENLYDTHTDNLASRLPGDATARRAQMIKELSERRDQISKAETEALAERVVRELLGLEQTGTAYAKLFGNMARDPGTLKERQSVPPEIRHLLGQIRDPGGIVLSTLSAQAGLRARYGVYYDLLKTGVGRHIIPPSQKQRGDKFTKLLDGAQYGPLQGYYARPSVYDALTDQITAFHTWGETLDLLRENFFGNLLPAGKKSVSGILNLTGKITRAEKLSGVVLNPARWIGNGLGSYLSLVRTGNVINPVHAIRGLRSAGDYVGGTMFNTTSDLLEDALRYVNLESVDVAEMQRILGDKMKDYLAGAADMREADSALRKAIGATRKVAGRAGKTTLASYSILDNWAKLANFYERTAVLQNYYKAVGDNRSLNKIKEEAGHTTSFTNLSAERVASILRAGEKAGITKFMPYYAETFRTTAANYIQAWMDARRALDTPNAKGKAIMLSAALRRAIGNTTATALLPLVAAGRAPLISALAGTAFFLATGDDDDNDLRRRMIGDFNRGGDLIKFGVNENGMPVFTNVSQLIDPHGPVTDLIRRVVNADDDDAAAAALGDGILELLTFPQWAKAVAGWIDPTMPDSTIEQVWPQVAASMQEELSPNTATKIMRTVDALLPGIVKAQVPSGTPYITKAEEVNIPGVDMKELAELYNDLGGRFETLNPGRTLKTNYLNSRDEQTANRSVLNKQLTNDVELTAADVDRYVTEYTAKEIERLAEAYKDVESLRAWGFSESDITKLLKGAGWAQKFIPHLASGYAYATVSKESIGNAFKNKLEKMNDPVKAAELRTRQKQIEMYIDDNKQKLAEMGIKVED